ncbi:MAG TPA: isoprenylcysteine carboxylmethyltransferase family protein [Ignavibacteriaceae bacterium]|nr:isoprenylcysteine carboxylmethyltransferase family protein [Ignavibacteriaceae bacterium]
MIEIILISHLILFESMFFVKNMILSKKLKGSIRGKNKEGSLSIFLFAVTIIIAITSVLSEYLNELFIPIPVLSNEYFIFIGMLLLFLNLIISFLALIQMRDSWRVGIKEDDKTDLIIGGIFKITRNPYFLSYIVLFLAYILLVANILVIISSLLAFISIHKMIMKEEEYLEALHGEKYLDYKNNVPRYFLI